MAVAAVSSLAFDLVFAAAVYSLVGFEVSPNTVIGALTILGFALYDVVVVFDKIQENSRKITARTTQTYGEAANLAVNQMLMAPSTPDWSPCCRSAACCSSAPVCWAPVPSRIWVWCSSSAWEPRCTRPSSSPRPCW
jgi:hypothetical protein